ncbi:toll/interleukin-1 receptor domain-containing protein [Methanoculleus frigidifontis]|uniref:toll/interleukin-1 receptor domain-containing protein n=1 Tax=Methanoculleus frigidifontis TaxID=2584085 RepID=UPI0026587EB2|nr:TIR domain-containing protein [Methanoculleus sp. FWC-SCC1]
MADDFFISYNTADKSWAKWVAWALEEKNYSVRIDDWDFQPGNNFVNRMDNALKKANVMLLILSPDYLDSEYCQAEWTSKFCEDSTGEQRKIIPIMVRETVLSGLLKAIIHINLVSLNEDQAKERLLQGISQERGKPSHPPPFPGKETALEKPKFPGVTGKLLRRPCAYCRGTGKDPTKPILIPAPCPVCNGNKENEVPSSARPCNFCDQSGRDPASPLIMPEPCRICKGSGFRL